MVDVVGRAEWGARSPRRVVVMATPAVDTWVHHTVSRWSGDLARDMQGLQNFHMDNRGWSDIGYSFVVSPDGQVAEGRGWAVQGGHTRGHNSTSHGIAVIGNYEHEHPSPAVIAAVAGLIRDGIAAGHIAEGTQPTGGHRDTGAATACPGRNLYAALGDIRALVARGDHDGGMANQLVFVRVEGLATWWCTDFVHRYALPSQQVRDELAGAAGIDPSPITISQDLLNAIPRGDLQERIWRRLAEHDEDD